MWKSYYFTMYRYWSRERAQAYFNTLEEWRKEKNLVQSKLLQTQILLVQYLAGKSPISFIVSPVNNLSQLQSYTKYLKQTLACM